jgi:hypothetical protein
VPLDSAPDRRLDDSIGQQARPPVLDTPSAGTSRRIAAGKVNICQQATLLARTRQIAAAQKFQKPSGRCRTRARTV